MKSSVPFAGVQELPLASLVIGLGQTRVREVGKEIPELADSIDAKGLIEPIVVAPSASQQGMYEIICGQRRFLAHQELLRRDPSRSPTIRAQIFSRSLTEEEAKEYSLIENVERLDPPKRDLIDAVTYFYGKYGSDREVAAELGLSLAKVRRYLRAPRLCQELREMFDSGEVRLEDALRAQDAASVTGVLDVQEAIAFAREFKTMTGAGAEAVLKLREQQPNAPASTVLHQAQNARVKQVILTMGPSEHAALQQYAKAEQMTQDDAGASLLADALRTAGYLD